MIFGRCAVTSESNANPRTAWRNLLAVAQLILRAASRRNLRAVRVVRGADVNGADLNGTDLNSRSIVPLSWEQRRWGRYPSISACSGCELDSEHANRTSYASRPGLPVCPSYSVVKRNRPGRNHPKVWV